MRDFIIKTITSFFGLGYLPFVPGTFGSLGGLLVYYLVKDSAVLYLGAVAATLLLGLSLGGRAEQLFGKKDANQIVIDEALGMLLSLMFLPYNIQLVVAGFVLFRILDALKPYPCGAIQHWKGSAGVVSDDIVAGIYTNIILQVVARSASLSAS